MNAQGNQLTLGDLNMTCDTIAKLHETKNDIMRQKEILDKRLEKISNAISALTEAGDCPVPEPSVADHLNHTSQAHSYQTWEHYRELGLDIPEVCPASPGELRQIMEDYRVPVGASKSRTWEINKIRNQSALRLMGQRVPDGQFLAIDFAKLLSAAGLFNGPAQNLRTTLIRHMQAAPEEFTDLGGGRWQYHKPVAQELTSATPETAVLESESPRNGGDGDTAQTPTESANEDSHNT